MLKTDKIKVLIVENHELTRFGLKTALESNEIFGEIYEAENAEKGIEYALNSKPDIVVINLGLPDISGIEAARQIKTFDENIKILIFTSQKNNIEVWKALKAGVNGYCLKDIKLEKLFQVMQFVYEGAIWIDPAVAVTVLKSISDNKIPKFFPEEEENLQNIQLTERESDVLKLIVNGCSNREISKKLTVSIHTTKAHVCSILQKLSVEDRTQAAIKALKYKLV